MNLLVIDASVVVKWFIPEADSERATSLLHETVEFTAPDLLFAEAANAIWKKARRHELSDADAHSLTIHITELPIDAVPCRALATDAQLLAQTVGVTVYDAMYLVLAVRLGSQLVTADSRLHGKVGAFPPLARHIRLLRDARRGQ